MTVELVQEPWHRDAPEEGMGLCLSGGGYRAMLFHTGSVWRLYEAGLLRKLARISSVSGGSITAGVLALAWAELSHDPARLQDDLVPRVVAPLRRLASTTLDRGAIAVGALLPRVTAGGRIRAAYAKRLFGDRTLQDLPDAPRFVFNATNVQSGALWRFAKPYMRDYRVGKVPAPRTPLAAVVAASSAFPPFLSPCVLELDPSAFEPGTGKDLQQEPYTRRAVLTDGGVYDNLGLETVYKRYRTVLVSDAGGKLAPEPKPRHGYLRHSYRVTSLVDDQVRSLRKRQLIDAYKAGQRTGAYWGIRTDIAHYEFGDQTFQVPHATTLALANLPTRLRSIDAPLQERLINWGYAVTDAALRRHVDPALPRATGLPYPAAGFG
jgi:NTE family protein